MQTRQGEILKQLIKEQGIRQEDFAESIGVSRTYLIRLFDKKELKPEFIDKAVSVLGVHKDLFYVYTNEHDSSALNNPVTTYGKGIPVYDIDVTAGTSLDFSDHLPELIKGHISLPNFRNCVAFIMVRGDSMYPKFKAGDLIGLEPVQDLDIIQWGHAYVVVTHDNQRMLKYIRKGKDENHLVLKSESELYDDVIIPRKKVIKLFMAKGPVRDDWQ
jgi:transcriptional regulator with XRE-family HTH domain